jgi:hypothetical protein
MFERDERAQRVMGGAQERYVERIRRFRKDGRSWPRLRHHALWLLHNCVAHPLLAVRGRHVPLLAVELHELTSQWLNHEDATFFKVSSPWIHRSLEPTVPKVERTGMWTVHNVLAHMAIGLLPCKRTFSWHDRSARAMNVPGWV